MIGRGTRVTALTFGHDSPVGVRRELQQRFDLPDEIAERDWSPSLQKRVASFAAGECVDFTDVSVDLSNLSPFRRAIIAATQSIHYGDTLTYGELAAKAGFPGAARAVGQVMAANPVPLIIPCHRVIAAGGRLGGFSARSGLSMKQRLLDMEQAALRTDGLRQSPVSN